MISHQRGNLKRHLTSNLAMCFRTTVCVGQLRLNLTIPTVLDIYLILSSPNSGNPENLDHLKISLVVHACSINANTQTHSAGYSNFFQVLTFSSSRFSFNDSIQQCIKVLFQISLSE